MFGAWQLVLEVASLRALLALGVLALGIAAPGRASEPVDDRAVAQRLARQQTPSETLELVDTGLDRDDVEEYDLSPFETRSHERFDQWSIMGAALLAALIAGMIGWWMGAASF